MLEVTQPKPCFDAKTLEWKQFCTEHQHPNSEFKTLTMIEKVFKFMFCTAFREQCKKGGAARRRTCRSRNSMSRCTKS